MNFRLIRKAAWGAGLGLLGLGLAAQSALAVPSYSRQTALPCETCHTVPPQLTPFGRYFKIDGYVLSVKSFNPSTPPKTPQESLSQFPPLSAAVMISNTYLQQAVPGTQNNTLAFPGALALYYAGRIANHIGSFLQLTYDPQSDHFSMDMTDLRYTLHTTVAGQPVVWGIDANNQPTFADVWNGTPSEGFPYVASPSAPAPSATPMIIQLMQQVAGIGVYAWFNNSLYANVSVYRSAQIGQSQPYSADVISGLAPYWRVAWQHNWNQDDNTNSFEIGTFGMDTHLFPAGVSGATDNYLDVGLDSQYQLLFGDYSTLTAHFMYIHEKQDLNASFANGLTSNPNDSLNTWQISAQYYWARRFGPAIGYFQTTGSYDPLLYSPGSVSGSRTGTPDSSGWIVQWTYLPAQNVQLTAQYTIYTKFNGASSNYDGNGRNASDNNTLYLMTWILW